MQGQTLTSIIFATTCILIATSSFASPVAGLQEAEYLSEDAPPECLQGQLVFRKTADGLNIILGPRALVQYADKAKFTTKDRDCVFEHSNEIRNKTLHNKVVTRCGKNPPVTRELQLRKTENGLTYSISIQSADGAEPVLQCSLRRKN